MSNNTHPKPNNNGLVVIRRKPGPPKGTPKPPNSGGSRKGCPNKATKTAREAFSKLLDGNIDKLQQWLDLLAERDPLQAFRCVLDMAEFAVPKLARTEITGADGKALIPRLRPDDENV